MTITGVGLWLLPHDATFVAGSKKLGYLYPSSSQEYKSMNIEPVRLKAILTIYNINWTLGELITELIKESNSF